MPGCGPRLRRFWPEFDLPSSQLSPGSESVVDAGGPSTWPLVRRGVGVTGADVDECFEIVQKKIFGDGVMPGIHKVVEDIDVSTLDENEVLPNIEPPSGAGFGSLRGWALPYDLTKRPGAMADLGA